MKCKQCKSELKDENLIEIFDWALDSTLLFCNWTCIKHYAIDNYSSVKEG